MKILPFTEEYVDSTLECSNLYIGDNYFEKDQLTQLARLKSSFILVDEKNKVQGLRLSYPPGSWVDSKKPEKLCPELWKVPPEKVAYFQTIFLADGARGGGWGLRLSQASIAVLRDMGARAIVCHSWKESPHNSSMKYLKKLGFELIKEYPNYWIQVDYDCIRCGRPCVCTASEMIFYL